MSTTEDLLGQYGQYMKALNRNRRTIHAHVTRNCRFFKWAETKGVNHPSEVTTAHLHDYQRYLADYINVEGRPNSVQVQNQYLHVVASFFGWMRNSGRAAGNPARDIEYARQPQRLPRAILTVQDMRKLLRQPDTSTVIGFRDRTIMEVLYSTGIRRNELISLDIEDVNASSGFVMVREGKGSKDRVVPVGAVALRYLESYLNAIRPELLKYGKDKTLGALFLSAWGRRLSRNALNDLVSKYGRQARLSIPVSPHVFRHSFATHLIRNNAGVRHVQEMLGHRNLSSTQEYIRLTATDLKEAHGKFHPREKER